MFFMIGIVDGTKEFEHNQTVVCGGCGRYGRYIVYMTYTVLSFFFIPCAKWNKQYYVRMSCCGKTYRLDPEVGRQIEKGIDIEIKQGDLEEIAGVFSSEQTSRWAGWTNEVKTCENCGYSTDEDFDFCPKCGQKFR